MSLEWRVVPPDDVPRKRSGPRSRWAPVLQAALDAPDSVIRLDNLTQQAANRLSSALAAKVGPWATLKVATRRMPDGTYSAWITTKSAQFEDVPIPGIDQEEA